MSHHTSGSGPPGGPAASLSSWAAAATARLRGTGASSRNITPTGAPPPPSSLRSAASDYSEPVAAKSPPQPSRSVYSPSRPSQRSQPRAAQQYPQHHHTDPRDPSPTPSARSTHARPPLAPPSISGSSSAAGGYASSAASLSRRRHGRPQRGASISSSVASSAALDDILSDDADTVGPHHAGPLGYASTWSSGVVGRPGTAAAQHRSRPALPGAFQWRVPSGASVASSATVSGVGAASAALAGRLDSEDEPGVDDFHFRYPGNARGGSDRALRPPRSSDESSSRTASRPTSPFVPNSPAGSDSLDYIRPTPADVAKEGWLWHESPTWTRYYVVATYKGMLAFDSVLHLYMSDQDTHPIQVIEMQDCANVIRAPDPAWNGSLTAQQQHFGFRLTMVNGRSIGFAAPSQADCLAWVHTLNTMVARQNASAAAAANAPANVAAVADEPDEVQYFEDDNVAAPENAYDEDAELQQQQQQQHIGGGVGALLGRLGDGMRRRRQSTVPTVTAAPASAAPAPLIHKTVSITSTLAREGSDGTLTAGSNSNDDMAGAAGGAWGGHDQSVPMQQAQQPSPATAAELEGLASSLQALLTERLGELRDMIFANTSNAGAAQASEESAAAAASATAVREQVADSFAALTTTVEARSARIEELLADLRKSSDSDVASTDGATAAVNELKAAVAAVASRIEDVVIAQTEVAKRSEESAAGEVAAAAAAAAAAHSDRVLPQLEQLGAKLDEALTKLATLAADNESKRRSDADNRDDTRPLLTTLADKVDRAVALAEQGLKAAAAAQATPPAQVPAASNTAKSMSPGEALFLKPLLQGIGARVEQTAEKVDQVALKLAKSTDATTADGGMRPFLQGLATRVEQAALKAADAATAAATAAAAAASATTARAAEDASDDADDDEDSAAAWDVAREQLRALHAEQQTAAADLSALLGLVAEAGAAQRDRDAASRAAADDRHTDLRAGIDAVGAAVSPLRADVAGLTDRVTELGASVSSAAVAAAGAARGAEVAAGFEALRANLAAIMPKVIEQGATVSAGVEEKLAKVLLAIESFSKAQSELVNMVKEQQQQQQQAASAAAATPAPAPAATAPATPRNRPSLPSTPAGRGVSFQLAIGSAASSPLRAASSAPYTPSTAHTEDDDDEDLDGPSAARTRSVEHALAAALTPVREALAGVREQQDSLRQSVLASLATAPSAPSTPAHRGVAAAAVASPYGYGGAGGGEALLEVGLQVARQARDADARHQVVEVWMSRVYDLLKHVQRGVQGFERVERWKDVPGGDHVLQRRRAAADAAAAADDEAAMHQQQHQQPLGEEATQAITGAVVRAVRDELERARDEVAAAGTRSGGGPGGIPDELQDQFRRLAAEAVAAEVAEAGRLRRLEERQREDDERRYRRERDEADAARLRAVRDDVAALEAQRAALRAEVDGLRAEAARAAKEALEMSTIRDDVAGLEGLRSEVAAMEARLKPFAGLRCLS